MQTASYETNPFAGQGFKRPAAEGAKSPEELLDIVTHFAGTEGWLDRIRLRAESRWYERLHHSAEYDVWVISWMPGQSTGFHDHGESSGAFVVATGVLEEHGAGRHPLVLAPGERRAFGRDYAHDVRNASQAPAVSIHAYSPPLSEMNEYELEGDRLVPREEKRGDADTLGREQRRYEAGSWEPRESSIDQMLAAARTKLRRLSPEEALKAVEKEGAVLVDIRPEAQRAAEGSIPGAVVVERNVLEWRFDPSSSARLPVATNHNLRVIVFCSEGYTSSLAAAALQELGLWRTTDIIGGYTAWRKAFG